MLISEIISEHNTSWTCAAQVSGQCPSVQVTPVVPVTYPGQSDNPRKISHTTIVVRSSDFSLVRTRLRLLEPWLQTSRISCPSSNRFSSTSRRMEYCWTVPWWSFTIRCLVSWSASASSSSQLKIIWTQKQFCVTAANNSTRMPSKFPVFLTLLNRETSVMKDYVL